MRHQSIGHTIGLQSQAKLARNLFPFALSAACLWLLTQQLGTLDITALNAAFLQISPVQWALAVLSTAASFWAVGRYDAVLHRHFNTGFNTGVPLQKAVQSGAIAIAFSQTTGLGLLTGSFARWRMLPSLPIATSAAITLLCALSFLLGLGFITSLTCLLLQPSAAVWAIPTTLAFLAIPVLALLAPSLMLPFGKRLTFPSLPAMGALTSLTFLDTLFAGLALFFLVPDSASLALTVLLPAFLIALAAGITAGTPAGLGPFELTLFALLPQMPEPKLAAGILAFRLIYYALPAALAGAYLLIRPSNAATPPRTAAARPTTRLLFHARRSELGIARQNGAQLLQAEQSSAFTVQTPQTLTALFDPAEGDTATLLPALTSTARSRNRLPVLYKCSARSALAARHAGFALAHIADEALINPQAFSLQGAQYRQLRRKLRQAAKAGLHISNPTALPYADMSAVDAQWCARNNGARGFSMGRYCAQYLGQQRVYLAYQNEALVGFASFHVSAHELCLDLMRSTDACPDGTMHALINQAIEDAQKSGRSRLSLAALPARKRNAWLGRLTAYLSGSSGLAQFKDSFAPRYAPLYMAAPTHLSLGIAMLDLARSITGTTSKTMPPPPRL